MTAVLNNETAKGAEAIAIVKELIKEKIPAKPKFYGLCLVRDLLETRRPGIIAAFTEKLMERLYTIATFDSKNKDDYERGARCLNTYYVSNDNENNRFSKMFFVLLLECWKEWDADPAFGPIVHAKSLKLRPLFPTTNTFYDHLIYKGNKQSQVQSQKPSSVGHRSNAVGAVASQHHQDVTKKSNEPATNNRIPLNATAAHPNPYPPPVPAAS